MDVISRAKSRATVRRNMIRDRGIDVCEFFERLQPERVVEDRERLQRTYPPRETTWPGQYDEE